MIAIGNYVQKKVIYLTGAPATGKSTLTEGLADLKPDTHIFTYSKELLNWLQKRNEKLQSQDDLRRESADVITRDDVNEVDKQLLELVKSQRKKQNIIIDSHPVTIEQFGFRVTPFTKQQLLDLAPEVIVCLYADASVITKRIEKNAAGRPLPSIGDLNFHMMLQAQIANQYAFEIGASIYFLNADCEPEVLRDRFLKVSKLD